MKPKMPMGGKEMQKMHKKMDMMEGMKHEKKEGKMMERKEMMTENYKKGGKVKAC